jgi:hypothetical protein
MKTDEQLLAEASERSLQRDTASFNGVDFLKETTLAFNRLFVNTPINPRTIKDLGGDI